VSLLFSHSSDSRGAIVLVAVFEVESLKQIYFFHFFEKADPGNTT